MNEMKLLPRLKFKSKHFGMIAEIIEINETENILSVSLTPSEGPSWTEKWNLQQTIVGFERGMYFLIEDDNCNIKPMDNSCIIAAILAASCPSKIPEWFKFESLPYTIKPPSLSDLQPEDQKIVADWLEWGEYDLGEDLKWFQEQYNKAYYHRIEIDRLNKENKFFAWRAYYTEKLYQKLGYQS